MPKTLRNSIAEDIYPKLFLVPSYTNCMEYTEGCICQRCMAADDIANRLVMKWVPQDDGARRMFDLGTNSRTLYG